jgi:adenylylsulfate kinase
MNNVVWHGGHVTADDRQRLLGQLPLTIWLTGLSASGKSTLAFALEHYLTNAGRVCYVLDGDNVRHGLNGNLGFSHEDRTENIRRIAEVAHLMNDAGLIVITAFISPYRDDRAMAGKIIGSERFREIHVSTPLEVCEQRDPKGLYGKAKAGKLPHFTGVSDPYEPPEAPAAAIDTSQLSVDEAVDRMVAFVNQGGKVASGDNIDTMLSVQRPAL